MRPYVDVVSISGVGLVVGVRSVVVFDGRAERLPSLSSMYRSPHDDTGWYSVSCLSPGAEGFAVVFEGGSVLRYAQNGVLRWHSEWAWDDVLTPSENGQYTLRFTSEGDGIYELDWETGAVRQ